MLVTDKMATLAERFDPASGGWASAGANLAGTTGVALPAGPSSVCGSHCGQAFVPSESADPLATSAFYIPRPVVTGVSPASGGANTTVTLTGTGLTAVSAVSFGAVAGTTLTHSSTSPDTSLTVKAPSGPSGAVTLIASSPAGTSSPAGPQFSYSTSLPSVVQNLTGQALDTAAALSWSPPASNGGSTITSYTVVVNAPVGGAAHANVSVNPAACSPTCSTTITGLSDSLSLTSKGAYSFMVYAANANGNGAATTSAPVYPQVTAGTFVPLTPARLLDTRPAPDNAGTCTPSPCATLGAGGIVSAQMAGQAPQGGGPAPVPAAGAAAVVLNLTAVNATAGGGGSYLTVWPSDGTQPNSSNLNYAAGPSIANLVTVKLGADGRVKLYNNTGSVDVVADVVGYYLDATAPAASRFNPADPARLLDTRSGSGNWGTCTPSPCATIGSGATITVQVAGQGSQGGGPAPVPAGAAAVILNLTVANPTAPGGGSFLTAWPSDAPQPNTSNVNFSAGRYVSNLVAVKLAPDGTVKLYNNAGSVDVIADVAGWYAPAGSISGDRFTPTAPGRVYDTRPAPDNTGTCTPSPCGPIGAGASASAKVAGQAAQGGAVPVPVVGASAVVANITVVAPSGTGGASYLTAWPDGATQPLASNLVYVDGQIVPILATVKLGANGRIRLFNNTGTANVAADVYGWFNNGTS